MVAVSLVIIYYKLNPRPLPAGWVVGTGRIDGDLILINTKYAGRVFATYVQDGQPVEKDELIARLKSDELDAKIESLDSRIRAETKSITVIENNLKIARVILPSAVKSARASHAISKAQKDELFNQIMELKLVIKQDQRDYNRTEELFRGKVIDEHELELARLKLQSDKEKLKALFARERQLQHSITLAGEGLKCAKTNMLNIDSLRHKHLERIDGLESLEARKKELLAMKNEFIIKAPVTGIIIDKVANRGEVLNTGMVVATMVDPAELYLKMYADTIDNGKIRLGDNTVIFLDSAPDKPISAKVVRIAQQAEFTPKEVNVRSDRIQRMFAVHIQPVVPNPLFKLGLPAIGVISIDGTALPENSKVLGDL